jgi:hypothetical protein
MSSVERPAPGVAWAIGAGSVAIAGDNYAPVTTNVFTGEWWSIKDAYLDPSGLFAELDLDRFSGREWTVNEINEFMSSHVSGYFLVEADAGLGKTAFAAWLAYRGQYACHFTRLEPRARQTSTAVRNLTAQLIAAWRLDRLAPDGRLPAGSDSQAWLSKVLEAVAEQRSRTRVEHPVILIVDGLDEAEPTPRGHLPLGLPATLPAGIFVIATLRTGTPLSGMRQPYTVCSWQTFQRRAANREDMQHYLEKTVSEKWLATSIAQADSSKAAFMSTLMARCAGVWLYLRYVLTEIQLGLRRADDVIQLPADVESYYTENICALRDRDDWCSWYLPLLATLAVAAEPVSPATLTELAGVADTARVRRLLTSQLRPFCSPAAAGNGERYSYYHASLRGYFTGTERSDSPVLDSIQTLREELAEAARQANHRICDHYLDLWGGLALGLPRLAAAPTLAKADAGYGLRQLPSHLSEAGRAEDLHLLMICQYGGGTASRANLWFDMHSRFGVLDDYLSDLGRALHCAELATNACLVKRELAPTLGWELRYALMKASVTSVTDSLPATLLRRILAAGLWDGSRALAHARRLSDPRAQWISLSIACDHLPPDLKHAVLQEALSAAQAIPSECKRGRALIDLAARLPPDLLSEALDTARAIPNHDARARILSELATHLPDCQQHNVRGEALTAARAIATEGRRAEALADLASHFPPDQQEALLHEALRARPASAVEGDRAEALADLASHFPPDQQEALLHEALQAARTIATEGHRARALADLASRLPPGQQHAVLDEALTMAIYKERNYTAGLVPRALVAALPADLLSKALARAGSIRDDFERGSVLEDLAPYLPQTLLTEAIRIARTVSYLPHRVEIMTELASHVPPQERQVLLGEALISARRIMDKESPSEGRTKESCVEAIMKVAILLPARKKAAILDEAIAVTRTIEHPHVRSENLTKLAAHLPENQQHALLAEALADACQETEDEWRASALIELAPRLPLNLITEAVIAAREIEAFFRADALAALAARPPAGQQRPALRETLDAIRALPNARYRERVLNKIIDHLPDDLLPEALAATGTIASDNGRARVLIEIASCLLAEQQQPLLAEVMATARQVDESDRTDILTSLAVHLRADLPAATPRTKDTSGSKRPHTEPRAAAPIYLSEDLIIDIEAMTDDMYPPETRALVLAKLAHQLPPEQRAGLTEKVVDAARTVDYARTHVQTLSELAKLLPPEEQRNVLVKAIKARLANRGFRMSDIFADLQADLVTDLVAEAFTSACSIRSGWHRAGALTELFPYLSSGQLEQSLAALRSIDRDDDRFWHRDDDRVQALISIAAYLPAALYPQLVAAAAAMPSQHLVAETLTGLAPHLPDSALDEALAIARALSFESARAEALIGVVGFLPASQRGHVLAEVEEFINSLDVTEWSSELAKLFGLLAPLLPPERRHLVFAKAINCACMIPKKYYENRGTQESQAELFCELLTQMPSDTPITTLTDAFEGIRAIPDGQYRVEAFNEWAAHLGAAPPAWLVEGAFRAACEVTGEFDRASALAEFTRNLPANASNDLLEHVQVAVRAIGDNHYRACAFLALATSKAASGCPTAFNEALSAAHAISDPEYQRYALTDIVAQLPVGLLASELAIAPEWTGEGEDIFAVELSRARELLKPEHADDVAVFIRQALRNCPRERCLIIIASLMPLISSCGGPVAIAECTDAVRAVHCSWP